MNLPFDSLADYFHCCLKLVFLTWLDAAVAQGAVRIE